MSVNTRNNITTNGLVLYYDFLNSKSYNIISLFDISGFGNNPTLTNITSSTSFVEFTRNNDSRITIPTLNLSSTNIITISTLINFKSLPTNPAYSGDYLRIICELSDDYTSNNDSFYIGIEYEQDSFRWTANDNGNNGYNTKNLITPLPIVNTWYNLVCIFDHTQTASNQRTFYINGIRQNSIGSTSNGGTTFNNSNTNNFGNRIFRIGGRSSNLFSSDILIGNFLIYNRALSQDEVNQNYNTLKSRFNLN